MRAEFQLFVVKSMLAVKKLKKEGLILGMRDIQNWFDKESLLDTCTSLARANMNTKRLRTWWKLNSRACLSVLTGVGESKTREAMQLLGQRSCLVSLTSQLNLDMGINDYFWSSKDEECYGEVMLQPLTFQDDEISMVSEVRLARVQAIKLHFLML